MSVPDDSGDIVGKKTEVQNVYFKKKKIQSGYIRMSNFLLSCVAVFNLFLAPVILLNNNILVHVTVHDFWLLKDSNM